jgi:hypothetical protein
MANVCTILLAVGRCCQQRRAPYAGRTAAAGPHAGVLDIVRALQVFCFSALDSFIIIIYSKISVLLSTDRMTLARESEKMEWR